VANQKNDGRRVRGAVVGRRRLPVGGQQVRVFGNRIDIVGQPEGDDVGLQPSMTDRACLLEPPWDWLISTSTPVLAFHCLANAALMSW